MEKHARDPNEEVMIRRLAHRWLGVGSYDRSNSLFDRRPHDYPAVCARPRAGHKDSDEEVPLAKPSALDGLMEPLPGINGRRLLRTKRTVPPAPTHPPSAPFLLQRTSTQDHNGRQQWQSARTSQ